MKSGSWEESMGLLSARSAH